MVSFTCLLNLIKVYRSGYEFIFIVITYTETDAIRIEIENFCRYLFACFTLPTSRKTPCSWIVVFLPKIWSSALYSQPSIRVPGGFQSEGWRVDS